MADFRDDTLFGRLTRAGSRLRRVVYDKSGPLTRELLRRPGGFGLGQVPDKVKPDATTTMVCGFCATGCGLDIHLKDGQAINLSPATEYPVNLGMACPKGWEALTPLRSPDRALTPYLRDQHGVLRPTDWQTALDTFVTRFKAIQAKHGPESVAFLSTGQITFEEMALLGALGRFGMGIKHCDGNTRQCMATAATAYKQSFGFDAPPFTYADLEASDVLIFIGANPCIAHPIMWERVCKNPNNPHVIVLDPRRTETAQAATQHLPLRPKSDLEVLYAVAHVLIREGWIDRAYIDAHTEGFDEFAAHVAAFPPERAAQASGLSVDALEGLARTIHRGQRVSLWWTMGVNQSHEGTRTAQAIINIALMTGNIGKPGTGPNSITGQCNAMGSRLFSNTTGLFAGQKFEDPDHRARIAQILGLDESIIPHEGGWTYDQIMEGIVRGSIRGLWVIATNTAHSWVNQTDARDLLDKLDFLVVQDMYTTTETVEHADLLLPAAGWGEKEGCFINSERRIAVTKQISKAPGQALSDFRILKLIAEAWGCGEMFRAWETPEDAFRLLRETTRGTPCDITGVEGYRMLDQLGGLQWPFPTGSTRQKNSEERLFGDGHYFWPNRRAKFLFDEPRPAAEIPDKDYPLWLMTGRGSSSQWHTQTRTSKSDVLRKLYPSDPYVELSPRDALNLGIEAGAWVLVRSRRGCARVRAFPSHIVQPGQTFMPMHDEQTNRLTYPSFDPHSRQPSFKACAVRIEPVQT